MSLVKSYFTKEETKEESIYEINLTYQIFTNKRFAKPVAITADYYRLIDPEKPDDIFKLRVPFLYLCSISYCNFWCCKS
jgi:hypothetical protein